MGSQGSVVRCQDSGMLKARFKKHGQGRKLSGTVEMEGTTRIADTRTVLAIIEALQNHREARLCLMEKGKKIDFCRFSALPATDGSCAIAFAQLMKPWTTKVLSGEELEIFRANLSHKPRPMTREELRVENESIIEKARRESAVPTRVVTCPNCGTESAAAAAAVIDAVR